MTSPDGDSNPEQLMNMAHLGDSRALGDLLEMYREYLRLLAQLQIDRRLQRKFDASDVVQDVFLQVHRHFPEFRGATEGEFLSWLRKILASCVLKSVRRYNGTRQRQLGLERDLQLELDNDSKAMDAGLLDESTPSRLAARREEGVRLANELARLPDDYRQAVVLRHLEGLTFPEIAERMDRTVESVKKLWARGLSRLRTQWEVEER